MEDTENKSRRISVDLPDELIARFDKLKKEWGHRSRGAVLKRLLEELLTDEDEDVDSDNYARMSFHFLRHLQ